MKWVKLCKIFGHESKMDGNCIFISLFNRLRNIQDCTFLEITQPSAKKI